MLVHRSHETEASGQAFGDECRLQLWSFRQIADTGKVDFLYNEVWGDEADFTRICTPL